MQRVSAVIRRQLAVLFAPEGECRAGDAVRHATHDSAEVGVRLAQVAAYEAVTAAGRRKAENDVVKVALAVRNPELHDGRAQGADGHRRPRDPLLKGPHLGSAVGVLRRPPEHGAAHVHASGRLGLGRGHILHPLQRRHRCPRVLTVQPQERLSVRSDHRRGCCPFSLLHFCMPRRWLVWLLFLRPLPTRRTCASNRLAHHAERPKKQRAPFRLRRVCNGVDFPLAHHACQDGRNEEEFHLGA